MNDGNKQKIVRWFDYVDRAWPIFVGCACFIFLLGGRLEDDQAKIDRIKTHTDPISARLERMEKEADKHHRKYEELEQNNRQAVSDIRLIMDRMLADDVSEKKVAATLIEIQRELTIILRKIE